MLKRYFQFINESDSIEDLGTNIEDPKIGEKYSEVKQEILSMIENTIKNNGGEGTDQFIESFIKNSEDVKIEGLINDSDIYDFYLKWRNDIDEVLNDVKYYDEVPSDMNIFGLYDYIIKGTKKAIEEFIKSK